MLIRTLFFALLACNIAYYTWQVVETPATDAEIIPATEPGVPMLVLIREKEQELLDKGWDEQSGLSGCFSIGPFLTQADVRRATTAIAPFVERIRQRQVVQNLDRGFWVYLPAMASRDEALAAARNLSLAGLNDYYVVTAGDNENTVSLGLFREEENARRRHAALVSLGFNARISQRTEESLIYWLDYRAPPKNEAPWQRVVASGHNLEHLATPCFNERPNG